MPLIGQALWALSYAFVSAALALAIERAGWVSWEVAVLTGSVIFIILFQMHSTIQQRRERREADHRMMALYEDYQTALKAVDTVKAELEALRARSAEEVSQGRAELVAEMKVLQTLLSQVAAKSMDAGGEGKTAAAGGRDAGSEVLNVMHNALEENRVDLYLQPIVRLPSRKPVFYEGYSRVRDVRGRIIFPRDFLPLAAESGLVGTLDNLLLFRCIQVIRRLGPRRPNIRFFCNIAAASLRDQDFFPQFIDFMINNLELADRLVFEFSQADVRTQGAEIERSLAALGRRGFHFSMDQVTDLNIDVANLASRHFSFVKISADLFLAADPRHRAELQEALARHEIDIIIVKIEDEPTVINILDFGIEYGQGFLFGEPRPSRDDAARQDAVLSDLTAETP